MPDATAPPSTADAALLDALSAWGRAGEAPPWDRFSPRWRGQLAAAWGARGPRDPEVARACLVAGHYAGARVEMSRVHPSWWVRALKDESPAVQRAVAAHAPTRIAAAVRDGLELAADDLQTDRPADPEAIGWALALWHERLVGDAPRHDDPPVIAALAGRPPRALYALARLCGLAKFVLANPEPDPAVDAALRRADRAQLPPLRDALGGLGPKAEALGRRDVAALTRIERRTWATLGLTTLGRLLAAAEPHRVRWALQHVPYPIAKRVRSQMPATDRIGSWHATEARVWEGSLAILDARGTPAGRGAPARGAGR